MTPTNPKEIEDLFGVVKRITEYWKCRLNVDGVGQSSTEFLSRLQEFKDFNEKYTKSMFEKVIRGELEILTLFATMWPLEVGREEAKQFVGNPENFYQWLHDKQSVDAYYATPGFYQTKSGVEGRYAVTETTRSIFPVKPKVPYGTIDPDTGKQLE